MPKQAQLRRLKQSGAPRTWTAAKSIEKRERERMRQAGKRRRKREKQRQRRDILEHGTRREISQMLFEGRQKFLREQAQERTLPHTDQSTEERFIVHALIVGDGKVLEKGQIYASSKKDPDVYDDWTCWKTEMDPVLDRNLFNGSLVREIPFNICHLEETEQYDKPAKLVIPANLSASVVERQEEIVQTVKEYLEKPMNAGKVVKITANGARDFNQDIARHHIREKGETFATAGSFNCAEAAFINGVNCLQGKEVANNVAISFYKTNREVMHDKLRGFAFYVQQFQGIHKSELRRVALPGKIDCFEWISSFQSGVFMIRFENEDGCNHTVCVDSRPDERAIWDHEELFAVSLSAATLRLCGGGGKLYVGEVRELVVCTTTDC